MLQILGTQRRGGGFSAVLASCRAHCWHYCRAEEKEEWDKGAVVIVSPSIVNSKNSEEFPAFI